MILVNHLTSLPRRPKASILQLARLLTPFAPHLAEEIYARLGGTGLASLALWPTFRPEDLIEETVELPIQVNSKVKGKIKISPQATKDQIEAAVQGHPNLSSWTSGKKLKRSLLFRDEL